MFTLDNWQPEIYRELVLGYLVYEKRSTGGINVLVSTYPITSANSVAESKYSTDIDEGMDGIDIQDKFADVSIKGVLPAPFPTYQVSVSMPEIQKHGKDEYLDYLDDMWFLLGYEHPTLKAEDWYAVIIRKIKAMIMENESATFRPVLEECLKLWKNARAIAQEKTNKKELSK